jgi:nitroreductase
MRQVIDFREVLLRQHVKRKEVEKMDVHEAIERRRTIRKFKSPATEEQLQRILLEGVKAPSASNRQPWEFVIVDHPDLIKRIAEIKYHSNMSRSLGEAASQAQKDSFANATLILVYYNGGRDANTGGAWACIENMALAAVAEGLASRIAGFFEPGFGDEVNKLVGAPKDMKLAAAISIGVAAEVPGPRKLRPTGSWLHRNTF